MDRKQQPLPAVLPTHTPELFTAAVRQAADHLRAGQVIALPTETVYGLAANAFDAAAVARIFQIKGRPAHNPIIVHVASLAMARECVAQWPELGDKLARAFWPGPLTLVLPRAPRVPDIVTAGGGTVGVRWPSHPLIQAVIRDCGFPLAAPSANPSNRLSPTDAEHVRRTLGSRIGLIVDGGRSQVGIESTVLDLTVAPPRLLRPGMIHEQALAAVIGRLSAAVDGRAGEGTLKSPGQLRQHYAPKARLVLRSWRDDADLLNLVHAEPVSRSRIHILAHTRIPAAHGWGRVAVIPHDAPAFARALYAELHQCDLAGAELIVVEALPETAEWRALADRLARASARD